MPAPHAAEYCPSWTRNEPHLIKFTRQFGVPCEVARDLALGERIDRSVGDGHGGPGSGQAHRDRADTRHHKDHPGNLAGGARDLEDLDGSLGARSCVVDIVRQQLRRVAYRKRRQP